MLRTTIERRLSDAHQRLQRARSELAVLVEQIAALERRQDDLLERLVVGPG